MMLVAVLNCGTLLLLGFLEVEMTINRGVVNFE